MESLQKAFHICKKQQAICRPVGVWIWEERGSRPAVNEAALLGLHRGGTQGARRSVFTREECPRTHRRR